MRPSSLLITAILALTAAAPVAAAPAPGALQPTKPVDLSRYGGRWFEIARLHNRIEDGCASAVSDYTLKSTGGDMTAVETCRPAAPGARNKVWRASVKVLDPGTNAKLRMTFFPFVYRDYWVLDHAANYDWAIAAQPNGRYLWLFDRQADPPPAEKAEMIARAKALGFDTGKLIYDR